MLKIVDCNKEGGDLIQMNNMKPLQVGTVVGGGYDGCVVMRTYSSIKFEVMNITDSHSDSCWTDIGVDLKVRLFPKGESITVELFNP